MAILYFIHIFLFFQLCDTPKSINDFIMVEDRRYKQFPWNNLHFQIDDNTKARVYDAKIDVSIS